MADEMDALRVRIEAGEPPVPSRGLRGRIGYYIRRRLYRWLWWQTQQMQALADLAVRRSREETKAIDELSHSIGLLNPRMAQICDAMDALSQRIGRLPQQIQETHHIVLECRRQLRESESRFQQLEATARYTQELEIERTSLRQQVSDASDALNLAERRMAEQIVRENAISMQLGELAQRVEAENTQTEQIAARLSELGLFTHHTRAALSVQERRLSLFIEEARKGLLRPSSDGALQKTVKNHTDHKYDSLYTSFEDTFRGSREEIKSRQSVYLPLLKQHDIGSKQMPILDLGCGRGEWLELLREHDLHAIGLDSNEAMIELCKAIDLEVIQGQALPYLGTMPDASVGAVTAFHMVEHMPFDAVMALVDEMLRVLKSGGLLIVETPNPENLLVAAHTFYLDPTHLKPLPSAMLRFFVEARGFCDVDVRELHPYPDSVRLPEDGKGIASRLNGYFYGPQDYAVIGRRP
ncbi:MAG TPA: methyltransferase domain-containing protein [Bryobacteraceae bacterium]|nr:methyltransferase domain-containing protein [Bryobacteraceae bacterium]